MSKLAEEVWELSRKVFLDYLKLGLRLGFSEFQNRRDGLNASHWVVGPSSLPEKLIKELRPTLFRSPDEVFWLWLWQGSVAVPKFRAMLSSFSGFVNL